MINSIYVDNIIKTALLEDINYLDVTTDYLIDEEQENTARFLAKDDGILCGIDIYSKFYSPRALRRPSTRRTATSCRRAISSPRSRARRALSSRANAPRSTLSST